MQKNFNSYHKGKLIIYILVPLAIIAGLFLIYKFVFSGTETYEAQNYKNGSSVLGVEAENGIKAEANTPVQLPEATHIKTPEPLHGIYMTSWIAGAGDGKGKFPKREAIVKLIDETEINAVVIDIKDATGFISFRVDEPTLKKLGTDSNRIPDIEKFIKELHDHNIYVIGRVAVFQDPNFVKLRPDLAVKSIKTGKVWTDRHGIAWLDAGAKDVWDYVLAIAKESHRKGFDEIQFDYVRFPSDGDTVDIKYPFFGGKTKQIETTTYEDKIINSDVPNAAGESKTVVKIPVVKKSIVPFAKHDEMKEFYDYIGANLLGQFPISVDLFGYTTTNKDDLGIGQIIEDAAPDFNYVSPMVYPSHYNQNAFNLGDPNKHPGEVVYDSMAKAVERFKTANLDVNKLRPWLQDFNYPVKYTADDVLKQIAAVYKTGLTSWILWDPGNTYTRAALKNSEVN